MNISLHALMRLHERAPKTFSELGFKLPFTDNGNITKVNRIAFESLMSMMQKIETSQIGQLLAMAEKHGNLPTFYLYKDILVVTRNNAIVTVYPQSWASVRGVDAVKYQEPISSKNELIKIAKKHPNKIDKKVIVEWDKYYYLVELRNPDMTICHYVKISKTDASDIAELDVEDHKILNKITNIESWCRDESPKTLLKRFKKIVEVDGEAFYKAKIDGEPYYAVRRKNGDISFLDTEPYNSVFQQEKELIQDVTRHYKYVMYRHYHILPSMLGMLVFHNQEYITCVKNTSRYYKMLKNVFKTRVQQDVIQKAPAWEYELNAMLHYVVGNVKQQGKMFRCEHDDLGVFYFHGDKGDIESIRKVGQTTPQWLHWIFCVLKKPTEELRKEMHVLSYDPKGAIAALTVSNQTYTFLQDANKDITLDREEVRHMTLKNHLHMLSCKKDYTIVAALDEQHFIVEAVIPEKMQSIIPAKDNRALMMLEYPSERLSVLNVPVNTEHCQKMQSITSQHLYDKDVTVKAIHALDKDNWIQQVTYAWGGQEYTAYLYDNEHIIPKVSSDVIQSELAWYSHSLESVGL